MRGENFHEPPPHDPLPPWAFAVAIVAAVLGGCLIARWV